METKRADPGEHPGRDWQGRLRMLMSGDPLGVRALITRELRQRCLLLDPERLALRCLIRLARDGERPGELRVRAALEQAIVDLVDEAPGQGAGVLGDLAGPLQLAGHELEKACHAFNRLTLEQRQAFHGLLLQRTALERLAGGSLDGAQRLCEVARAALQRVVEHGGTGSAEWARSA
ncbi:MAG: hypothetical protein R3F33_04460 [Planctomycetota bacterium]